MPNFGDETAGTDTFPSTEDRGLLSKFTLTEAGTVTGITVRWDASSTAGTSFKGLIYSDVAGVPTTKLAVGAATAIPGGGGLVESVVSPGVDLTAGDYWLGAVTGLNSTATWMVDTTGVLSRMEAVTYASPATTWAQAGTSTQLNVYATYTVAGAVATFGYSSGLLKHRVYKPRPYAPGNAR